MAQCPSRVLAVGIGSQFYVSLLERLNREGTEVVAVTAPRSLSVPRAITTNVYDHFALARGRIDAAPPDALRLARAFSPAFQFEMSFEIRMVTANLLERASYGNSFSDYEMTQRVDSYFTIAESLLNCHKPSSVFFPHAPHLMYDLAIYYCAKKRGIATIFLQDTHIPYNVFAASDVISPIPLNVAAEKDEASEDLRRHAFEEYTQHGFRDPLYMHTSGKKRPNLALNLLLGVAKGVIRRQFMPSANHYKKSKRSRWDSDSQPSIREFAHEAVSDFVSARCLAELSVKEPPKNPFIYVPLSLQIERTSMPQAGMMYQQQRYINWLLKNFGQEFPIVVKENPKQAGHSAKCGVSRRSTSFYQMLRDEGAIFIDPRFSSAELMNRAAATAVTTGTAGFESIVHFRKPTIAFVTPWYAELPGVAESHLAGESNYDAVRRLDKHIRTVIEPVVTAAALISLQERLHFGDINGNSLIREPDSNLEKMNLPSLSRLVTLAINK